MNRTQLAENIPPWRHFELVDALRGFAAISVLIYHCIDYWQWTSFPSQSLFIWFRLGWLGVDIFFVISGFAITLAALKMLEKQKGPGFLKTFMARRFRRIAPLHYLSLAIFLLLFPELIQPNFYTDLSAHLLFLHNLSIKFHRSMNPQNWSLGVEMQFYLALAILIPFIVKSSRLWLWALGAIFTAWAWRALSFLITVDNQYFSEKLFMKTTQVPGMLDLFACGILIALFSRSPLFEKARASKILKLLCPAVLALAVPAAIKILLANGEYWHIPGMVIFYRSLTALCGGLLVFWLCLFSLTPLARKILAPLIHLGTVSYGIYLLHLPVVFKLREYDLPVEWKFPLCLLITIAAAALSWHFFEKPILSRGKGVKRKLAFGERGASHLPEANVC